MFSINHSKYIDKKAALISGKTTTLLFDEVPILFTGKNEYGNHIIGSNAVIDYDTGTERYFHILVAPKDYRLFQSGFVSYLNLLKGSEFIFVIDKKKGSKKESIGVINFSQIPLKYCPTEYSYFPKALRGPSFEYSTKIGGGSADEQLAIPEDVSTIQNEITHFLDKGLNTLRKRLGFDVETRLRPATEGSYEINYNVKLSNCPGLIASETQILDFINTFAEFCIEYLPSEIDQVMRLDSSDSSSRFDELCDKAMKLVPIGGMAGTEELKNETVSFRNDLRRDVLSVPPILKTVADVVTKSYATLEFDNSSLPLGTIDHSFKENLETVLIKLDQITIDSQPRSVKIMVYSFNKQSGKGRADVIVDEQVSQITFHVLGFQKEESSVYISSMAEDRLIVVRGTMTFKNLRPHHLDIQ